MTPELRIFSGSFAARPASALTDAEGALDPAAAPHGESEPQPASARAAMHAVARPSFTRTYTGSPPLDPDQKVTRGRCAGALLRGVDTAPTSVAPGRARSAPLRRSSHAAGVIAADQRVGTLRAAVRQRSRLAPADGSPTKWLGRPKPAPAKALLISAATAS